MEYTALGYHDDDPDLDIVPSTTPFRLSPHDLHFIPVNVPAKGVCTHLTVIPEEFGATMKVGLFRCDESTLRMNPLCEEKQVGSEEKVAWHGTSHIVKRTDVSVPLTIALSLPGGGSKKARKALEPGLYFVGLLVDRHMPLRVVNGRDTFGTTYHLSPVPYMTDDMKMPKGRFVVEQSGLSLCKPEIRLYVRDKKKVQKKAANAVEVSLLYK